MAYSNPKNELQAAWVLLRLDLREAAAAHRSAAAARIAALPATPPDPAVVEPIARLIVEQLQRETSADEPSPTLRILKKTFRPSPADKRCQRIQKTFNAYLKAWQAQSAG